MFLQVSVCPQGGGGMRGSWGDMHGKGGACMAKEGCVHGEGGVRGIQRDMEIRSMSGWYASYWNALLFLFCIMNCIENQLALFADRIRNQ